MARKYYVECKNHETNALKVWLHDDGLLEIDEMWSFTQPCDYSCLQRTINFVVEFLEKNCQDLTAFELTTVEI